MRQCSPAMSDQSPAEQPAPGPRRRRWWRWLGVVGGSLLLVLTVLYVFRWQLFGDMVRASIAEALGSALHAEVRVGDLSGDLFTGVALSDLVIEPQAAGSIAGRLEQLDVEWSLWGYLSGGRALQRVHVAALDIHLQQAEAPTPGAETTSAEIGAIIGNVITRLEAWSTCPDVTIERFGFTSSWAAIEHARVILNATEDGGLLQLTLGDEDQLRWWPGHAREAVVQFGLTGTSASIAGVWEDPYQLSVSIEAGDTERAVVLTSDGLPLATNGLGVVQSQPAADGAVPAVSVVTLHLGLGVDPLPLDAAPEAIDDRGLQIQATANFTDNQLLVAAEASTGAAIALTNWWPHDNRLDWTVDGLGAVSARAHTALLAPVRGLQHATVVAKADDLAVGPWRFDRIDVDAAADHAAWRIERGLVQAGDDRFEVTAAGTWHGVDQVELAANLHQLDRWIRPWAPDRIDGGQLDLQLRGTAQAMALRAALGAGALRTPGGALTWNDVVLIGHRDRDVWTIERLAVDGLAGTAPLIASGSVRGNLIDGWRDLEVGMRAGDDAISIAGAWNASDRRLGASGQLNLPGPWLLVLQRAGLPLPALGGVYGVDAEYREQDAERSLTWSLAATDLAVDQTRVDELALSGWLRSDGGVQWQGAADFGVVDTSLGVALTGRASAAIASEQLSAEILIDEALVDGVSAGVTGPLAIDWSPHAWQVLVPSASWAEVVIEGGRLRQTADQQLDGRVRFSADDLSQVPGLDGLVAGAATIELTASGQVEAPQLRLVINGSEMAVDRRLIEAERDLILDQADIELALDDDVMRLERLELGSPEGRLSATAAVPVQPAWPLLRSDAPLSASIEASCTDLAVAGGLFGPRLMRYQPAGALALDLQLTGTAAEPAINGHIRVTNGSFQPPQPIARITDLNLELRSERGHMTLGSADEPGLTGMIGGGPLQAWGTVDIRQRRVDLCVSGRDVLVANGRELRDLYVRVSPELTISGRFDDLLVQGTATVPMAMAHTEFAGGSVSDEPSSRELGDIGVNLPLAPGGGVALPAFLAGAPVRFDVALSTPRPVVFANSTAAGLLRVQGTLSGTATKPVFAGVASTSSGEVRATIGTFLPVDYAILTIPPTPGLGPTVAVASTINFGLIRIQLSVSGALSAPTINLSSDPPYPQDDLLNLVLLGVPPEDASEGANVYLANQALRIGSAIYNDRLPTPIPPDESLLDRLNIELGDLSQQRDISDIPIERLTTSRAELLGRVEYRFNDRWSVITGIDRNNDLVSDLQLRFSFGKVRELSSRLLPSADDSRLLPFLGRPPVGRGYPAVGFEGNQALDDGELGQALTDVYRDLGLAWWSPIAIADASFRLRRVYLDRGYADVVVDWRRDENGRIVFEVTEGPLITVAAIDLEWVDEAGRDSTPPNLDDGSDEVLSPAVVRGNMYRPVAGGQDLFSWRTMQAQSASIANFLRSQGWLEARVTPRWAVRLIDRTTRQVVHRITAGRRYRLAELRWQLAPEHRWVSQALHEQVTRWVGRPLTAVREEQIAAIVRDHLRDLGHLEAAVTTTVESIEAGVSRIVIAVTPGPRSRRGRISVVGNDVVDEKFIARAANLSEGEIVTTTDLLRAQRRLLATGMFRSVALSAIPGSHRDSDGDRVDGVEIEVAERERYEVRLRVGYGTLDEIRTGGELVVYSPLGSAETLRIGGEFNLNSRLAEVEFTRSFFLGQPWLDVSLLTFYEFFRSKRPDYEQELLAAVPSLGVQVDWLSALRVGLTVAEVNETDIDRSNTIVSPFISAVSENTDAPLRPRAGTRAAVRVETANSSLGSSLTYARISVTGAAYIPLTSRLSLALGAQFGRINTWGDTVSSDLPVSFRFTTGGANSVRGFQQDILGPVDANGDLTGGDVLMVGNIELRADVSENYQVALFADVGNAFADSTNVDASDLRLGIGTGVRYYTPAGAIMVEVGYNPDREPGEDVARLHISFGKPF